MTGNSKSVTYKFLRFYLFSWSTSAVRNEWGAQWRSQHFSVKKD